MIKELRKLLCISKRLIEALDGRIDELTKQIDLLKQIDAKNEKIILNQRKRIAILEGRLDQAEAALQDMGG